MKIYLSAFLSLFLLLALAGCGAEQFGITPQNQSSSANAVSVFQQSSCSNHTLIKPEVDILYVVDNSSSNVWVTGSVKSAIQNTINSISSQFDYRVIGTPILPTANVNEEYQVLSKSTLPTSIDSSKIVTASNQFSFFNIPPANKTIGEKGLRRVQEFITAHQSDGLFRQNAYLFIVLVSNGRDTEVEGSGRSGNFQIQPAYGDRRTGLLQLKAYLNSQQFRLFSLTSNTSQEGFWASSFSYGAMSQDLYNSHPGFPSRNNADHYEITSNVSAVFSEVNASIQQIIVPHSYKYWPITSTNGVIDTSPGKIRVFKSSPGSASVELTSGWSYYENPSYPGGSVETRVDPVTNATIVGEPSSAHHLISFSPGNYITYPDCVSITTATNIEYFGYITITKKPKLSNPVPSVKINGNTIPKSVAGSDGWEYVNQAVPINIKVNYGAYTNNPPVMRSGHMFKLNGSANYYKSGDNVEVSYQPETN